MGSLLQIKPVMHVDNDGHLVPVSKARGRKASIQAMAAKVGGDGVRSRQADDVHQPWRLPAGRRISGGAAEAAVPCAGGRNQLCRAGDRLPFRPRYIGALLPGRPSLRAAQHILLFYHGVFPIARGERAQPRSSLCAAPLSSEKVPGAARSQGGSGLRRDCFARYRLWKRRTASHMAWTFSAGVS